MGEFIVLRTYYSKSFLISPPDRTGRQCSLAKKGSSGFPFFKPICFVHINIKLIMKKFLLAFVLSSIVAVSFAQIENPVQWNFSAKKINATTYEIHLTAKVESDWHIYSQTTPEGGPIPTSISFNRNPLLSFDGATKESGKLEQHFEELFGVEVKQFSNKVDFI